MRNTPLLTALSAALLSLIGAVAAVPAQAVTYRPGAASLNDPLAPGLGNGGYDVSHYDIRLTWDPATGRLRGTTTIIATLTQDLSSFDLDFALPASSVTVDGVKAAFLSKDGPEYSGDRELVVTPAHGLDHGDGMTVVVTYDTKPASVLVDGYSNWASTPTGIMCWNEPDPAAEWWFPGNDHPSDKATYDVFVSAPQALTAVTNGRLVSRTVSGSLATAHWTAAQPMASYVSMLAIGRYDVVRTTWGSVPVYDAYEQGLGVLADRARADVSRTPEILSFLQKAWGPYPYDAAGGIVVGYGFPSALETQTRPIYESGLWQNNAQNTWAIVHENAHQWFGDSATMRTWSDIWLAEGFATYSEWLWSQTQKQGTTEQLFLATYNEHPASDDLWTSPLDQPFYPLQNSVYERGAMLLQALRNRVGATAFTTIMRDWAEQHRTANGSTKEFETLASSVSGQNLKAFFTAWVDTAAKPARTVANGFPSTGSSGTAASDPAAPRSLAAIERTDAILAR